jgi:hypothetical protein
MRPRVSPLPIGRPKGIQPAAYFQSSRTELSCRACGERRYSHPNPLRWLLLWGLLSDMPRDRAKG